MDIRALAGIVGVAAGTLQPDRGHRVSTVALIGSIGLALGTLALGNASAGECAGGHDTGHSNSLACGNDTSIDIGQAQTSAAFATAVGPRAYVGELEGSAVGYNAKAGAQGTAFGAYSKAGLDIGFLSSGSTAIGMGAEAGVAADGQNEATALGHNSTANALNATALGAGATANFLASTAIGQGASTTRDNQVAIGTGGNTYTLAGVNSQASKDAQGGQTYLMTTDGRGNLAVSTFDTATLEALPAQVAQNSTDITTLNTTVNSHTTQITANTTELADHETRITNNTTELADHETRITSNTDAIAVNTAQISGLDTRVTTNTTNIAQLDGRVGALESSFQDLGGQISENRTEARAGIALALATAGLRYDDRPGKLSLAGGFGNFKGQSGLALGLGYNPSLDFRLNGAISATTNHGDVGVSLGASWTLN
ncbi:YadA-like family protein [Mesorhizobium sp. B2-7-1]|uniref:YadA-like family protein n=1 Tax=Mesorhizobium sp. B2-7-1 TaxID=2589909 RepID=UPI00112AA68C|nr:YadA-like family protein [Mesorhizobium sp. B2-7-1]TPJ50966.1 hypothetical protein FJ471_29570 [Mesorhizobium sp. B2-7-1]